MLQTIRPKLLCEATKAELVRRAAEEYEFVTKCDTKQSEVLETENRSAVLCRASSMNSRFRV